MIIDKNKIELIQSPVISHRLKEMGQNVSNRISELNIYNQIATEDTIKSLKKLRAELSSESKDFEEQRKSVKNTILEPYKQFEDIYKEEIIQKYEKADDMLKEKIGEFEIKIKQEKRDSLIAYFDELCLVEKLDWLKYEKLGIEVNLSTSLKKYKQQVLNAIKEIKDDVNLIATENHEVEILVEYKKTLNVSKAIQLVRQRKIEEKEVTNRLILERSMKRTDSIRKLQFISHDLTRTYNWINDESIMVRYEDIDNMTDEEWQKKYLELESKASVVENPKQQQIFAPVVSAPVSKPQPKQQKEEAKEELYEAKFLVNSTFSEMKALGEFLKSNNYNYKNIE